ncbi:putative bifunctional diguanylate cyclase/phosphodiesterase [Cryptosporangium arvum]|uniref:Diguanylate cyclase (GGDEF) domain-containing protein n=1 Tax=Cryptosporangium arvum DSM 44712 TaxID=927661 RepID=A0A010ZX48_9ACTN|nr:bifunctional diguanylate cyclase/phosphodiesterase [Cryptosporangium arvum]EXG81787.1 diguanylate cyclase (GGDEF) domain-containing protein [Cryptosporangium arvum DSM 44712]
MTTANQRGRRRIRPSVIATGPAMARTAGACYVTGGVIGLVSHWAARHDWGGADRSGTAWVLGLSVAALLAGVGLALAGRRLPQWTFYAISHVSAAVLTLEVWLLRGRPETIAIASLFVIVVMYTSFFFEWAAAALTTAHALTAIVVAKLLWDAVPWVGVVALVGLSVLVAGITVALIRAAADADVDGLTGLPNRRGFDRLLQTTLTDAERGSGQLSVAILDLDGFTATNEQQGRAEGDKRLQTFARDWVAQAGEDVVMARHGADEFAIVWPGATSGKLSAQLDAFRAVHPEFSAGVAVWQTGDTASLLASRAEIALYEAKSSGGGRTFSSNDAGGESWMLLSSALTNNEFSVAYQPIVSGATGLVTGAEALLRWNRPGKGPVSPAEFIPIAESSGFISKLDHWVLETACREAAAWPRAVPAKVTVNVSGRELHQPDYYQQVVDVLIRTGLPAQRLVLEVTESTMEADSPVALDALRRLRADGVRIAIDDFGTGYSSLSRLHHLPADILKIDRSFVSTIQPQDNGAPLIAAITGLAHALGLTTVAEGVEQQYQADVLRHHGCDENQGWLHGRPDAPELIHAALAQQALSQPSVSFEQRAPAR